MTVEFDLLLSCCRWCYSSKGGTDIRRLSRTADWGKLVHLANRHRVQSLASRALRQNEIALPPAVSDQLCRLATSIAEQNLRSTRECARLLEAFTCAGVDLLFVKGLTLSALAYGDPFLKMSSDIDIVVDPAAIADAAGILASLGYRTTTPAVEPRSPALQKWHKRRKESDWLHPESGLRLDLHTALADNRAVIPSIGLASPRQLVTIGKWAFPTLATQDLFTYLSVHGTWSAWFRLKWIADIAALVHRAGAGAAESFYRYAISRGAGRAPGQALLLAHRLFKLELPPGLWEERGRGPAEALLGRIALRELHNDRSPTERPLGTLAIHLSRPFLLPGWSFKYLETQRQLHDVIDRFAVQR